MVVKPHAYGFASCWVAQNTRSLQLQKQVMIGEVDRAILEFWEGRPKWRLLSEYVAVLYLCTARRKNKQYVGVGISIVGFVSDRASEWAREGGKLNHLPRVSLSALLDLPPRTTAPSSSSSSRAGPVDCRFRRLVNSWSPRSLLLLLPLCIHKPCRAVPPCVGSSTSSSSRSSSSSSSIVAIN